MADESNPSTPAAPAPLGEIEHGPSKFEQFLEKNFKLLIAAGLAIAVGVAAYLVFSKLNQAKNEHAGHALVAAKDANALREVSAQFPGTASDGSAQVLLAEQLWIEGKKEDALKTLETFTANNSNHPAVPNARFALATMAHSEGDATKARSLLESILSDSNAKFLHPLTLVQLGDLAKAAGDEEAAKAYYNRKIDEFPDYADNNLAVNRLNLVGVAPPERLKPAPPAPTPATPVVTPSPVEDPVTETPEASSDVPNAEAPTPSAEDESNAETVPEAAVESADSETSSSDTETE